MKELAWFVWLEDSERQCAETPVRRGMLRALPGNLLLVMVLAAGIAGLLV
jgi:hypothetical protein